MSALYEKDLPPVKGRGKTGVECADVPICVEAAQMTKRTPCPPRGQDLPSSRGRVTARDKELAQESPLLVDRVNLDKSPSFSEPPSPHT